MCSGQVQYIVHNVLKKIHSWRFLPLLLYPLLSACEPVWNNPYTEPFQDSVLRSSFSERPKYLDPARSYSSAEAVFIGQIYEPPLQYHYLKRPYTLVPLTARSMPTMHHLRADGQRTEDLSQAVWTVYEIEIKDGIFYQPHPALARDEQGQLIYHQLDAADLESVHVLSDFAHSGSRAVTAADYVYQIKRLADPRLASPIAGVMAEYIDGFAEFRQQLQADTDLRTVNMRGVRVLDRYRYTIKVDSDYPQFIYWLAMNFFTAMPWEAEAFYSQPGMSERNLVLNWYPIGTGPYLLSENNPNRRMVMERNPNYREDYYPTDGSDNADLLLSAGQRLPFIDRIVFSLEKENIPSWNKFLQGYYDSSGITSDNFDYAIQVDSAGRFLLSDTLAEKSIQFKTMIRPSIFYTGFNMLDPVVGGFSEPAIKLRRALSIAINMEEFISIFLNGRGSVAHSPLPPGLFGHRFGEAGINPYVYEWRDGHPVRRPLEHAHQLMKEAGYPRGIDASTGQPLVLYLDTVGSGPDSKSLMNWMRKQFARLGVQLVIRNTDYNRFQDKIARGKAQIFRWGWNADYPDPENFFFLLYGPNARVPHEGANSSNYDNPQFNRLFVRMKGMANGPLKQDLIDEMVDIFQRDAPWFGAVYPQSFYLHHHWYDNVVLNPMAHNVLKYRRIDSEQRQRSIATMNRPRMQPIMWSFVLLLLLLPVGLFIYRRRERATAL